MVAFIIVVMNLSVSNLVFPPIFVKYLYPIFSRVLALYADIFLGRLKDNTEFPLIEQPPGGSIFRLVRRPDIIYGDLIHIRGNTEHRITVLWLFITISTVLLLYLHVLSLNNFNVGILFWNSLLGLKFFTGLFFVVVVENKISFLWLLRRLTLSCPNWFF